jgi:type I restriction enzyme S subunit
MPKNLPNGWVRTTLGQVCAMNPRMPFDEPLPDHTEVSFVPMAAVEEESGRLDASQVRALGSVRRGYTPFIENDVIFAKITPCMENGKIALATGLKNGLAYGSTEFFVFRPYEGLLPRFVLHFLLQPSLREAAEHQMSGASGQKRVPANYLSTHEFLLPPLPEQERIVEKLDATLSGVERAETAARRARERLKRYRSVVLNAAVTGELTRDWRAAQRKDRHVSTETGEALLHRVLEARRTEWKGKGKYKEPALPADSTLPKPPEGWTSASLEQLTSANRVICYGILMPKEHVPDGIPYVKVRDMKGEKIDFSSLPRTSPKIAAKYTRSSLKSGDILLAIRGTYGRIAEVPPELEGGNITQDTARLAFSGFVDRRYLASFLRSEHSQNYFNRVARGMAVKGVNIGDVRLCPVLLPPLAEQTKIVEKAEKRLSAAARLAASLEQQLVRAAATRQSLLCEAFEGRLVPQDPRDELASVLLERIQALREAAAHKPKGKRMKKSQPKAETVHRPLIDVLREHKKPMTPEELFRAARYEPSEVDDFYREMTLLRDKVLEQKPKASDAKLWPHHAHVLLQLRKEAE